MKYDNNVTLEEIHRDVEEIKKQLSFISAILVEKMSEEDIADYEQAMKEYKEGKTISAFSLREALKIYGRKNRQNKKHKVLKKISQIS